ncbi:MAG: hypothetical protein NTY53_01935 [Kiritimatiellaeota bacterium]|nr:hypothetical protein [Kiritimatiellota bacterium]
MKALMCLAVAGMLLTVTAAEPRDGALRNLAWAAVTLEKIEKDLGELTCEPKGPDAVAEARTRLAALKQVVATADAESESIGKAADLAKNVSDVAHWTIDRTSDLDGKRTNRRKMFEERSVLAKTAFGKQLDDVLLALANCSVRQAAAQLAEKQAAVVEAEAVWNLQSLRYDQLMDEADNEAGWLDRKEELLSAIRDSGKQIKLDELETARAKVRAARQAQQKLALEKQKLANQTALLNQQIQTLDEKGGQLNEATDQAREAFDQAQGKVQEALEE